MVTSNHWPLNKNSFKMRMFPPITYGNLFTYNMWMLLLSKIIIYLVWFNPARSCILHFSYCWLKQTQIWFDGESYSTDLIFSFMPTFNTSLGVKIAKLTKKTFFFLTNPTLNFLLIFLFKPTLLFSGEFQVTIVFISRSKIFTLEPLVLILITKMVLGSVVPSYFSYLQIQN